MLSPSLSKRWIWRTLNAILTRSDCLRLQTPQAFNYSLLKSAYATGKYTDMTDETRVLFEEYGIAPTFLDGGENLYKVTYPKDLAFLEAHFSDFLETIVGRQS